MYIVNPLNNNLLNLFSNQGKIILKNYVTNFLNGGSNLVNKINYTVHGIWIGKLIDNSNLDNFIQWRKLNKNFNFILWFDSLLLFKYNVSKRKFNKIKEELEKHNIKFNDINTILEKESKKLIKIYKTEVGLLSRENVEDKYLNIRNYGMATDLLRLVILKNCKGIYIDVDLIPTPVECFFKELKIVDSLYVSSKSKFGPPFTNSLLFFNGNKKGFINKIINKIIELLNLNLYNNKDNYLDYLTGKYFKDITVAFSGPGFYDTYLYNYQKKIKTDLIKRLELNIKESKKLQNHTWIENRLDTSTKTKTKTIKNKSNKSNIESNKFNTKSNIKKKMNHKVSKLIDSDDI